MSLLGFFQRKKKITDLISQPPASEADTIEAYRTIFA